MPYLFSSAAARAARAESLSSLAQTSHTLLNATERMVALSSEFGRKWLASSSVWQTVDSPRQVLERQTDAVRELRSHWPQLIGNSVQIASDTQEALASAFQAHVDCTRQLMLDSFGAAESTAPWELHPWLRTLHNAIDSSVLTSAQLAGSTLRQVEQAEQQVAAAVSVASDSSSGSRSRRSPAPASSH